jgi:signal transduction histidine kinase
MSSLQADGRGSASLKGVESCLRLPAVYLISVFLITAIIAIDVHTEAEISLSVFYLLPVMLASWYGNRTAGLVVSMASGLAWVLVDVSEREHVHSATPYWEAMTRLGTYLFVASAITQLRGSLRREHEQLLTVARLNETLEEKDKERTRELQENIRELEAFTYTMAHDFRAPLRALHGFSDMLQEEHGELLKEAGCDYLRRISASAAQMDSLVRDLLDYGHLIHQAVDREPVELGRVLDGVLRSMEGDLQRRRAALRVERPTARVLAQPALLSGVLRRLLANAAQYVRGGSEPEIRIRTELENGWVRLWIEDNGIGIAPEHRERLFKPGERLEPGGSGLGLAFARKAMERMRGRVGVESQVGKGSRFWLELPSADPISVRFPPH